MKAATRPTKEEARSADIVRCHRVCWNDARVDRSIEVECLVFSFGVVRAHTDGDFVPSSMSVPWGILFVRASSSTPRILDGVRGVHTSGVWASYHIVRTRGTFGRPLPRLATIGRESATTTLGERRARGETTAIGGSFELELELELESELDAREAAVRLERGRRVRSFVGWSVATGLNRLRRRSSTRASETRSVESRGARNRGGWRRDARGGMNFARRWRRVEREG